LGGKWAVPGDVYAQKIAYYANVINNTLDNSLEDVETITNVKEDEPYTVIEAPELKEPIQVVSPIVSFSKPLDIIIQLGHVGRTTGATGAKGEQEFNKKVGAEMDKLLKNSNVKYRIMGADDWLKPKPNKALIFLALHADGSTNPSARGFSMGFKKDSNEVFKELLAKNYAKLSGLKRRKDNYTTGMAKYYGWKNIDCKYTALIEAGFMTNQTEHDWLVTHIKEIAKCYVDTIIEFMETLK
jgi:N-acetylmuramoyl-L-alanine amidase